MKYPLSIYLVKSRATGRKYYVGVPSADVDYVTDGMLVLTSKRKNEIFLCMTSNEEYPLGPDEAGRRCAVWLGDKLGRDDIVPVLSGPDDPASNTASGNGGYSSWSYAFKDIDDENNYADELEQLSCDHFIEIGGTITDLRTEKRD